MAVLAAGVVLRSSGVAVLLAEVVVRAAEVVVRMAEVGLRYSSYALVLLQWGRGRRWRAALGSGLPWLRDDLGIVGTQKACRNGQRPLTA